MAKEIRVSINKLRESIPFILEGIAYDLVEELKKMCPVDKGSLKNSIKLVKFGGGYHITSLKYAWYVEYGTPPHIIRPKNKKSLAFEFTKGVGGRKARLEAGIRKGNANEIIVREVKHPGTSPQPFIRPILNTKLKEIILNNFTRHLNG